MTDAGVSDPKVEWLQLDSDAAAWRSIGLTVTADGTIPLVGTSLRVGAARAGDCDAGAHADETALIAWGLSGVGGGDIDGLTTEIVEPPAPMYADHRLGASGLDHVVVLTADLARTSEAITASTGCELKRVREVGTMRQGFHRIGRGGLIVELVERPDVEPGPARFWGLVLIVADLDAACELIGSERISEPRDAVQPGRRIATVRREVGLGVPLALMSH